MTKPTKPQESRPVTIRIYPSTEKELRRLAKLAGGVDRALRKLMRMEKQ